MKIKSKTKLMALILSSSLVPSINAVATSDIQVDTNIDSLEDSISKESILKYKEKLIESFITITDFIFYDTEIDGIKFSDLKDEAKIRAIEDYNTVVSLIGEENIETLEEKYKIASSKVQEKYDDIKASLENKEEIKEDVNSLVTKTKTKIKTWYKDLKKKY